LKIVDYGLAKDINENMATTFCGTPEYLAPEMIRRSGHEKGVDWWAFGVLM
jgi:protein kinase A